MHFTAIPFSLTLWQGKPRYAIANSYAIGPAMYGDAPQPTDFLVHYEGDAEPTTMRMRDVRSVGGCFFWTHF